MFAQSAQSIELKHPINKAIATRLNNPMEDQFRSSPSRSLAAHEQLFRQGESKQNVYLITQGAFVLYRLLRNGRRQVVGFAGTGEILGLGAARAHHCTAEAISAARVRSQSIGALNRSMRSDGALGLHLYENLSIELEATQELLLTLGRLDAGQRVATFLLSLSKRSAAHGRDSDRIELVMTRADIADYLGLTTETISRMLTRLVNARIIKREGLDLRILDQVALGAVAEGSREL